MAKTTNQLREVSYTIRFPPELHRSLKILAAYKDESINKLILDTLTRSQMGKKGLMIAKTRLTNAEAELRELELAEQRGDVIRKSAVSLAWGENVVNCKSKLLSIPTKIAPELVGQDLRTIQQKLKLAIYEALKELADYDKQFQ